MQHSLWLIRPPSLELDRLCRTRVQSLRQPMSRFFGDWTMHISRTVMCLRRRPGFVNLCNFSWWLRSGLILCSWLRQEASATFWVVQYIKTGPLKVHSLLFLISIGFRISIRHFLWFLVSPQSHTSFLLCWFDVSSPTLALHLVSRAIRFRKFLRV